MKKEMRDTQGVEVRQCEWGGRWNNTIIRDTRKGGMKITVYGNTDDGYARLLP